MLASRTEVVILTVSINNILKEITANDSEEAVVLVIQLLEVHVFDGVGDLILESLVHYSRIFVDSLSFIMMKLELVLVGRCSIWWYCGVYSQVGRVGPCHG